MSGESDSNKEFMEQLRLQELYGQRKEDGTDPYTYTDPEDGTVYDWDHDKKAWFPKVCTFHYFSVLFCFAFYVCASRTVIFGKPAGQWALRPRFGTVVNAHLVG